MKKAGAHLHTGFSNPLDAFRLQEAGHHVAVAARHLDLRAR